MARLIDITGKAISGEWGTDDLDGSGIPVLRTTNFTNTGEVSYANVVTRSITKKNISNKFLRKGDIIIEKSGGSDKQPVGRVIYFEGEENKYLFNNFTGLLRVVNSQKWYSKYVFYSLYAYYQKGGTRAFENKTTGLHNLKLENYLNAVEVRNLSLEIQVQRSFELDKLRKIITLRRTQLAKLDELVKCRFVELFGDPVEVLKLGKTQPLGTLAEEITVGYVGEAASAYTDMGVPYLRTQNVRRGYIDLSGLIYVTEDFHINNVKSKITPGDVVVSRVGVNRGMAAKIPNSLPNANIANCLIIKKTSAFIADYLVFYLNLSYGRHPQFGVSVGSAQGVINTAILKKWQVLKPDINLQKDFAAFIHRIDKLRFVIQKSLDETQKLFDSLMQEYFD